VGKLVLEFVFGRKSKEGNQKFNPKNLISTSSAFEYEIVESDAEKKMRGKK